MKNGNMLALIFRCIDEYVLCGNANIGHATSASPSPGYGIPGFVSLGEGVYLGQGEAFFELKYESTKITTRQSYPRDCKENTVWIKGTQPLPLKRTVLQLRYLYLLARRHYL